MHPSTLAVSSMGRIGFRQLKIHCVVGVHPEERIYEQELKVDLQVEVDFSRCSVTDSIDHTVSYEELADFCTQLAQERKYRLLETFAWEAVQTLLTKYNIRWARIQIQKPSALPSAECAYVEFEQQREDHELDISDRRG